MPNTILIIEDDEPIADLVEAYLEAENLRIRKAHTGQAGIDIAANEPIDLCILDLMLPDMNGFDVCRTLRASHAFPIIMLTARDEATDTIAGLALGADDYVTKPFVPLELMARVKAQLRRRQRYDAQVENPRDGIIEVSGLVVDADAHTCTLDGRNVSLTPTEFSILHLLCARRGQPIGTDELYRQVWGEAYYAGGNNTVMVHIRHLREKLGDSADNPRYIKTVWGVGYKVEA